MYKHVLSCIKMNIVLDLRAIYGHFAGTPFIQPHLATFKFGFEAKWRPPHVAALRAACRSSTSVSGSGGSALMVSSIVSHSAIATLIALIASLGSTCFMIVLVVGQTDGCPEQGANRRINNDHAASKHTVFVYIGKFLFPKLHTAHMHEQSCEI